MNIFSSNFLPYPACSNRIFFCPLDVSFSPLSAGEGLRPWPSHRQASSVSGLLLLKPPLPSPPPNPPQSCFFLWRPQPPSASERRPPPAFLPARKAAYFPRGKEKILRRFSPFPYRRECIFMSDSEGEREKFFRCVRREREMFLFSSDLLGRHIFLGGIGGRGFCGGEGR